RFRVSVILDMIGFSINLVLILWLVRGPDDAWLGLLSLLISAVLCQVSAHVIVLRSLKLQALRFQGGLKLLRECTALFAHRGFGILMVSSTTYLASLVTSETHVGLYGAADRVAGVGLGLLEPASQVLVGTVARHLGTVGSQGEAYSLMRKGFALMFGFGLLMLAGTHLLAGTFLPLLMGPQFTEAVPILKILAFSFPLVALCQVVTGFVLIPLRMDSVVSTVSLVIAPASVVLILVLGHSYEGIGVAWARSLTYVLLTFVLFEVMRRKQLLGRIFPRKPVEALGDA
ncbi:MAG: polysaccharide biosynthesis family protein, partial [Myxococcaceae bacterium]|nr:polysaccharide biosynthesis family protein [Myxococcaceae bacterium]